MIIVAVYVDKCDYLCYYMIVVVVLRNKMILDDKRKDRIEYIGRKMLTNILGCTSVRIWK